jgi:CBS domain-containing protein
MPSDGVLARLPRAGGVSRKDVPTCSLGDRLGEVREDAKKAGWDVCVVVNDERIVLGILRAKELAGDPNQIAEQAMRPGPSTFRPHVPIEEMAAFMVEHDVPNAPVTTSEGRLVGVLLREDAEREAHRLHMAMHDHEQHGGEEAHVP